MNNYEGYIGYLKIRGTQIEEGILGARDSGQVILGFDEALRHFLLQQDASLIGVDFEIPVKIRKGSLEVLIPHTIEQWILSGVGIAATTYLTTAATQIAKNDFKNKDMKQVVKDSLKLMKSVIKIAKHVGGTGKREVAKRVKLLDGNKDVNIPDDNGIILKTTLKELEAYLNTPPKILESVTQVLKENMSVAIADIDKSGKPHEERIDFKDKTMFIDEESTIDDDVLFPELKHGEYVTLEGSVTRGNRRTNTIGFEYKGHILTCSPRKGNILSSKDSLFRDCIMSGYVSRHIDPMLADDKRPKIIFDKLIAITSENTQASLL